MESYETSMRDRIVSVSYMLGEDGRSLASLCLFHHLLNLLHDSINLKGVLGGLDINPLKLYIYWKHRNVLSKCWINH